MAKKRILVVEDFDDARDMMEAALDQAGYDVLTARSGDEAVAKAGEWAPDVVVMDLSMPRMDGWEATRLLRENPATRGVRVVVLTAHNTGDEEDRARKAGCDAFLVKPVVLADLIAVLEGNREK